MSKQKFFTISDNIIILKLKIKPNASQNKLKDVKDNRLCVDIKALPYQGKANQELIKILSKYFKTPKSSITISSGTTSKFKTLKMPMTQLLKNFLDELK